MTVGLVQTSYIVLEAALPMSVNVCAILIGLTEREVVVNLTTADGTAQGRLWNCIESLHKILLFLLTISIGLRSLNVFLFLCS